MLMAWMAFGDMLRPMDLIGLLVVYVGIVLTYRQSKSSVQIGEPTQNK
jgi:multidrug transporter EmrE-like cation transporter